MMLSMNYLSTVLLIAASFVDASGVDIVSEWNIDPVSVITTNDGNDYTLVYDNIAESLTDSNFLLTIYDGNCKADLAATYGKAGKETESSSEFTSLAMVLSGGAATVTFKLAPTKIIANTLMYDGGSNTMSFCCRFGLFSGENEINYEETVVTLTVAMNDVGFSVSDVGVATKAKESVLLEYKVVAVLCDGQSRPFNQGSAISVCIRPNTYAYDAGVVVSSIDAFSWTKGALVQPAITSPNTVSDDLLTSITSTSGTEFSFESILFAAFYSDSGTVGGFGSATLAFPASSSTTEPSSIFTGYIDLGTASNFVILAKSGISTVPSSVITGDIAVSPIAASAITGFNLAMDTSNTFSTDSQTQLKGKAKAPNYGGSTPSELTIAVLNMEAAYTDAAGRPSDAANVNIGGGQIGGQTLTPGVYNFDRSVLITGADLTLHGSSNDVFIIRTSGSVIQAANTRVVLTGGALAENIFWQVAGEVVVGAGSHLEGILLVKTAVTFFTGSSLNGRILSQTAVTLEMATITEKPFKQVLRGLRGLGGQIGENRGDFVKRNGNFAFYQNANINILL
jgi:hypothetical protein